MQDSVVKAIREGWSPTLSEAMKLPEQARRLDAALRVAERWLEVAREDSREMYHEAQYARDKLEEELSRVCFEMAIEDSRRAYGEVSESSASEDKARSDTLADMLLTTYCILRDAPADVIGDGSPRVRHAFMGALMAAVDAASEAATDEGQKPTGA
jgi:hypothetical protein